MPSPDDACVCPTLAPALWEGTRHAWKDRPFWVEPYRAIAHIPLGIGKKLERLLPDLKARGLLAEPVQVLFRNDRFFGGELWIALSREEPGAAAGKISGEFFSKYFEGHYRDAGVWYRKTAEACQAAGSEPREILAWYATCPKCAAKRGAVQAVLFAKTG